MHEQLAFESPAEGEARRDAGMAKVLDASAEWRSDAMVAIRGLALEPTGFTAEEVRAIVGDPPRPNAMGAVFHLAARRGWIRKVGYRKATRPSLHATELAVWEGDRPWR